MIRNFFCTITAVLLSILFFSCSGIIGYGVVLWTIPESNIADGTVVPVYLKSNIQHNYVIGNPETDEKLEVPLWQISEPVSRGKAQKLAETYREYQSQYARCALDGLPIREEPQNTSKQVYRLRNDEIIRVLREGKGTAPTTGNQALEGKWLSVITNDGHKGWCFSYNLRLFTMNPDGTFGLGAEEAQVKETDTQLESMLFSSWYPDYYNRMIASKEINLDQMQAGFKFDPGIQSGTIRIGWPGVVVTSPFNGVSKVEDGVYKFDETSIQVSIRNSKLITVQYMDSATGKPRSLNYITLASDVDVLQVISDENERRSMLFRTIKAEGPDYRSQTYGNLTFSGTNEFSWRNFEELVPSVISEKAGTEGTVSFKYFVPKTLRTRFDGLITFRFQGQEKEVNFFYKTESNGLKLTTANVTRSLNENTGLDAYTVALAVNPEVIYFQDR